MNLRGLDRPFCRFVVHCLDAFRHLRREYGPAIHLTGGLSNLSFGMPCRKLINEVFLNLAVEAGADSGIVDPVTSNLNRVFVTDKGARPCQLALAMLMGDDPAAPVFWKPIARANWNWPRAKPLSFVDLLDTGDANEWGRFQPARGFSPAGACCFSVTG